MSTQPAGGLGHHSQSDWMEMEKRYYMQTVRRQPVVIARGQGTLVWDTDGKEYLDFTSGWAVNNLGHCHPAITGAIAEQAATLMQTSNQFYTVPQILLAQTLVENSCLDKVFLCNSGAEAVEGAIKLARRYGKKNRNGAYEVITALNSFHGRTLTAVSATGQPHYHEPFQPVTPGFVHVEFNNVEAVVEATNDRTAAVLLEPVQGEGGVNIPAPDYLARVREWCDTQGLLLMLDEVQTGMGRLGTLFGYQQYDVEPDVMTLAKGLGGGVPIGALMAKDHCTALEPGDHGSTFGGNRADLCRRPRLHQLHHRERPAVQRPGNGREAHGRAQRPAALVPLHHRRQGDGAVGGPGVRRRHFRKGGLPLQRRGTAAKSRPAQRSQVHAPPHRHGG